MTEYRFLTEQEIAELKKFYFSLFPKSDIMIRVVIVFIISTIFSVILFFVSFFAEHKSLGQSILFGLNGYLFVALLVFFNFVYHKIRTKNSSYSSFEQKYIQDLKEKKGEVKAIEVKKVWNVFNPGYNKNEEPDLLFNTMDNKWICIPYADIKNADDFKHPKSVIKLHILKNSRHVIRVEFSGEKISLDKKVINEKNEWRNDDLPFSEVFSYNRFSDNIRNRLK